ncbi:MAG: hypothetical protein KKD17_01500 [Nanoarchaeota archaeon]|nr:hypothetical protein [Nanoarchaeota archaeon]
MDILTGILKKAQESYTYAMSSAAELADLLACEAKDARERVTAEVKERIGGAEEMMLGYIETRDAADALRRYSDTSGERMVFTADHSIIRAYAAKYTAQMADRPDFNRGMELYQRIHPFDNLFVSKVCDSLDPRCSRAWVGPTIVVPEVAKG